MRSISSLLISCIPKNKGIYRICKHYVDNFNNENNRDMATNGELYVLRKYLPKNSMAFDVGANEGEWSANALKINSTLHIHCFEPGSNAYSQLLERNFPPNVIRNNFGLSSKRQYCPMFIVNGNSRMNSIYKRSGLDQINGLSLTETETVLLDTIDNYCQENGIKQIDFLKLDIEGHELEALKGAFRLLSSSAIKIIQFEYGGCNIDARVLLKDVFNLFEGLPYSFYKIFPEHLKPIENYSQRLENFQYQNWLIIHNDDN